MSKPKAKTEGASQKSGAMPDRIDATDRIDALRALRAHYGEERWERLQRQALRSCGLHAEDLQALCIETLMTSTARHPDNAQAALCSAGNRLLIHLGSSLKPEDVTRFEDALKSAPKLTLADARIVP